MPIRWGEVKGDQELGGYHVVWSRDLVESAGGFVGLQTKEDALRILNFIMSTQEENNYGASFARNILYFLHAENIPPKKNTTDITNYVVF